MTTDKQEDSMTASGYVELVTSGTAVSAVAAATAKIIAEREKTKRAVIKAASRDRR